MVSTWRTDVAVAGDREEGGAAPAGATEDGDGDLAVVAGGVEREVAGGALPQEGAVRGVEGEHLAGAGGEHHVAGEERASLDGVGEGPGGGADRVERETDEVLLVDHPDHHVGLRLGDGDRRGGRGRARRWRRGRRSRCVEKRSGGGEAAAAGAGSGEERDGAGEAGKPGERGPESGASADPRGFGERGVARLGERGGGGLWPAVARSSARRGRRAPRRRELRAADLLEDARLRLVGRDPARSTRRSRPAVASTSGTRRCPGALRAPRRCRRCRRLRARGRRERPCGPSP